MPAPTIEDVLDALEELIGKVEDLQELEDLLDRLQDIRDRIESGEQPDPSELADLLGDLLELLTGKVPLGPYGWLVQRLIDFIKAAIEAGYNAALGIAWQRYKLLREQGYSHEEACELASISSTICKWLRLKWLQSQLPDAEDEEPEDEEEGPEGPGPDLSTPSGPRWPSWHDTCCSKGDNGSTKPEFEITNGPEWQNYPGMPNAWTLRIEIRASHPCGLAAYRTRVFNVLPPSTPGGPPNWVELQKPTSLLSQRTLSDGRRRIEAVVTNGVKVVVTATSNCRTFAHQSFDFPAP